MTEVHEDATTCPNRHAIKGYLHGGSSYGVMGKTSVIMWGIILLVLSVVSITVDGI